jgi:UDP-N-acetylmuramoyl-tripeptide--D-alanyl-D-alanine ligase
MGYWRWIARMPNFRRVAHRRRLVWTTKAKLLVAVCWILYITLILFVVWMSIRTEWLSAFVLVLMIPVAQIFILPLIIWLGHIVIQKPQERVIVDRARRKIAAHPGIKIAIAGSYGKTTMKEILRTVLEEKLHVAATHGNLNTPLGISRFVDKLDGTEDVLIFEFGEEKKGDVAALCELTTPTIGIMTGISSAHLATFGSIEVVTKTIFELDSYAGIETVYKNLDSELIKQNAENDNYGYSAEGCEGWTVEKHHSTINGTTFTAKKGRKKIVASTPLIGKHLLGPLVACIAIGDRLGLTADEITEGISSTESFEHRMQPRKLHGALIIDDTYNGNPAGVEAGLALLAQSQAKRRVYVTPGLVEQANHTQSIHETIGKQIATSADVVVLMKNSVTEYIKKGLSDAGFNGELIEIDEPLLFYENIDQFVAAGDVVLMQNDWTDNYA